MNEAPNLFIFISRSILRIEFLLSGEVAVMIEFPSLLKVLLTIGMLLCVGVLLLVEVLLIIEFSALS